MSTRCNPSIVSLNASISTSILRSLPLFSSSEVMMLKSPPRIHKSSSYNTFGFPICSRKPPFSHGMWGPYTLVSIAQSLEPIWWTFLDSILGKITYSSDITSIGFQRIANPPEIPLESCATTSYYSLMLFTIYFSLLSKNCVSWIIIILRWYLWVLSFKCLCFPLLLRPQTLQDVIIIGKACSGGGKPLIVIPLF